MDAVKHALEVVLGQEWLPFAGLIGFGLLGFFSDPPTTKDGSGWFKAAGDWISSKVSRKAADTPEQLACKERKSCLLSLRHLASTLPADERTTALEVLDTVDMLNARVSKRTATEE